MRRYSAAVLAAVLVISPAALALSLTVLVLLPATPALASAPPDNAAVLAPPDKAAVLAAWTRPSNESYRAWNEARVHPDRWSSYQFIWTSDYCSDGPDRPAGFDFRLPCRRHDFGYRNYKAMGGFKEARARLDQAFYADLRRQCATYRLALRPPCATLAWTYYRAARHYGAPKATPTESAITGGSFGL